MRAFRLKPVLYSLITCSLVFGTRVHAQSDSLAATTVNDDQMKRGYAVFTKVCVACHTKSDISGADFKIKWNTRPVFDLFNVIHTTMPDDAPGSLTVDQYVDVTSYLLRVNGAPGGGMPILAADTATLHKLRLDIVVPAPNIDSLLLKSDTTSFKLAIYQPAAFRASASAHANVVRKPGADDKKPRLEAIMTRPYRLR